MRTRTAALVLAASALTVGPPAVAHAATAPQAAPVVTADDNDSGSDAGKWGLAGLAGLLGLAGLAQAGRKRHDHRAEHRLDSDGVNGTARDTRR